MKNIVLLFSGIIFLFMFATLSAQSCDILYFCERYDTEMGEVNAGDRFYSGNLTVMTLLAAPVYYTKIYIQLDKYNPRNGEFEYYSDVEFVVEPDMDYMYFNDIYFGERGFYRVFMLDPTRNNIVSAIVEII